MKKDKGNNSSKNNFNQRSGKEKRIDALLAKGVLTSDEEKQLKIAIDYKQMSHADVVERLLNVARETEGMTPADFTRRYAGGEALELLIKAGAVMPPPTLTDYARQNDGKHAETIKKMLALDAERYAKNNPDGKKDQRSKPKDRSGPGNK